jgi:3-deoxy-D-manno-octulosonate 8-phosphate phosphatase (KDO 8-P phosphatase)
MKFHFIESGELRKRAKNITLAVFDVDGILTDGSLYFLPDGQEVKMFNTLDGLGFKLLQKAGVEIAIITGRQSPQVIQRAKALGVDHLFQGRDDKLTALNELLSNTEHSLETTAYIGDDLPDLSAINAVAFGASVPNGHPVVRSDADWITQRTGGYGAAREFCEVILEAKGALESVYQDFRA